MRNDFNIRFGEQSINFRFGTKCMLYFEEIEGEDFSDAILNIERIKSKINLMFCAYKDWCKTNGEEEKFTWDDCIECYDENIRECEIMMAKGLTQYIPKNVEAPTTNGAISQIA